MPEIANNTGDERLRRETSKNGILAAAGTSAKEGMPAVAETTATVGSTATAGKPALAGTQIRSARKWYGWLSLDK
jgi:hypothetical protein